MGAELGRGVPWVSTRGAAGDNFTRHPRTNPEESHMIGLLIAIVVAALVYWLCVALGLPVIIGIVAAILVLIGGVGTGFGGGWGRSRTVR
ncbi:hypothetical protein [Capillimicrobium parvum]|uniref:Uncharacterized protein n=1 Tax=Capillimicrobium parvum TaxID=2884022 RepID=A0A9E6Y0H2_9ACTN|nr:hypothetical protein [Capillimicrobium parvum]UGS37839.1 hypothetical protein DSM104329_04260 [Capillimicrobium parvum]